MLFPFSLGALSDPIVISDMDKEVKRKKEKERRVEEIRREG